MQSVLDLQLELWRKVAISNRRLVTGDAPELKEALVEFDRSFPEQFSVVDEREVLACARRAPFVLIGDYHTLPAAQLQAARWLRRLRPRAFGVEILSSDRQDELDRWTASSRPASALLHETSFGQNWPLVPERGFCELLETAREIGCRLLACEHPEQFAGRGPGLAARDAHMASYLKSESRGTTALLVGDVHLRPNALPQALGGGTVVLHQNQARYHFTMSRRGFEPPGYLRLGATRFCWQGVHPLLVEESCLRSFAREEDAYLPQPADWFAELAQRIGALLHFEVPDLPTLLTTHDPAQRALVATCAPKPKDAQRIVRALRIRGSHEIRPGLIVLHETGTNHVSEALGRWLLSTQIPPTPRRAGSLLRLVADARLEAAGFLSSILVNPLRRPKPLLFYRDALGIPARYTGLPVLARRLEEALALGAVLGDETWPEEGTAEALLLSRCVGQSLGAQLRTIWLQSETERGDVLALLREPLARLDELVPFQARLQELLQR